MPSYIDPKVKPNVKKELRNISEIVNNKSLNHDKELGNIEILFKKVE